MGTPYLSEIRIFSFSFPPKGWAFCNGQLMPINQNQALFALLGTTYGGNGQTTFALPNLQGRSPVHTGAGLNLGESAGRIVGHAHDPAIARPYAHRQRQRNRVRPKFTGWQLLGERRPNELCRLCQCNHESGGH